MNFSNLNLHLNFLKGCDLASLNLSREVTSVFEKCGLPQPGFYELAVWRKNDAKTCLNAEQIDKICGTNLRGMPFASKWCPDGVCKELLEEEVHYIVATIKRSDYSSPKASTQ